MPSVCRRFLAPFCRTRFSPRFATLSLSVAFLFLAPVLSAANNPVPYIDAVTPVSITPGSSGVTITVLGTGFVSNSTVYWNLTALSTTFVSATKLTASLPDTLDAAVGLGSITVVSPTPGGRVSNVVYLPVESLVSSIRFPSAPSSSVPVGNFPQGITAADFNGDGKLDLAVANKNDGTVSILLGNGNGTFTLKSTPSAGSGANWIAAGDFNEDGIPDLAVADNGSSGSDGVSILLGNGDGTFSAGVQLTTGNAPFAITAADFNHDGHLDLAVSNASSNTVTVFLGLGTGSFQSGSSYTVGNQPQQIVAGDFNENGVLDLAVTNESDGTVSVLLGTGTGTFSAQTSYSTGGTGEPIGLIVADFNGDNYLDLAAVNAADVGVLLGNGTGSFSLYSNPSTGSGDLIAGVTGDYDGDGKLDLFVSDRSAGQAFYMPGLGNGSFGSAQTFNTASGAFGVATADFNGDGALDLAVANGNANNTSIFLQTLPVSLSPAFLDFGNQSVGVPSSPARTITLSNTSGSSVTFSSIVVTGADSSDFSLGGSCSTVTPVADNSTCTITVTFTPAAFGPRTGTLTLTDGAGNSPQTLSLTGTGVSLAPSITKTFAASTIPLDGSTTLSFVISNPNVSSGLTGVAFTDSLPSGLAVATPNGLSGTCGSGTVTAIAGASSINLSGGTIAASDSCSFSVDVIGATAGAKNNSVSITSTEGGAGNTSNASVTVVAPPTFSESFAASTINLNASTSLTFTVSNPNSPSLTGISFSDTLPSGLVVATPNSLSGSCGGGTISAAAGSSLVSLSAATLSGGANCNFSVDVIGTAAGTEINTTGNITSTEGGTGAAATANLDVEAPPAIAQSFSPSEIAPSNTSSLTITLTNPSANPLPLSGVAFSETLASGLVVANPTGLSNTCGGTATASAGSGTVSLSGASISGNSQCTVVANVTSSTPGVYTSVTGSVTSTNGGTGGGATAILKVASPPSITKSFGMLTVPINGTTSLNFLVSNPNVSTSLSGVAFTDSLPSGLVIGTPNGLSNTCGGTAIATSGSTSVSLTAGTLSSSSSCAIVVNITGATAGVKNNRVAVSSVEGGAGNTSNASITVVAPPNLGVAFGSASIPLDGTTSLTFTVTNPNTSTGLSGIGFSDVLPAGLLIATPNGLTGSCGAGTITAAASSGTVSLSGASLSNSSSCNFSINVTGTSGGSKIDVTGAISSSEGGTGGTATASLAIEAPPLIAENFGAAMIIPNTSTTLTFTITNPSANVQSLTGLSFVDSFPSGIVVATPNGLSNSCGGTAGATAGATSVSLSGGTLAVSSQCTFVINVTAVGTGSITNTTGAVSSTNGGAGNTASASLALGSLASFTSVGTATFTVANAGSTTITSAGSPAPSIIESGSLPVGVTFVDNGNGTATLSGTPSSAGTYPITLTGHNGSGTDAVQSFMLIVNKGVPVLTWNTPTGIAYGTPLGSTQLDATSSVAGTFVYTPDAGSVLTASSQILQVVFAPSDSADYTGANATVTLTVSKSSPSVTWSPSVGSVTYGTPLSTAQLNAATNVPGTFIYTPSLDTVLPGGSQTLSVTFTPIDGADYSSLTTQVSLTVNPAPVMVNVSSSANSVNPGTSVTFTISVASSAGVPGGTVTLFDGSTSLGAVSLTSGVATVTTSSLAKGAHSLTATYSGSSDFAAGTSAAFSEIVTVPDFSLSASVPAPVKSGQSFVVPITITPEGGATGEVQFSLTGLPANATYAFNPAVYPLGSSAGTDTLTITVVPGFDYLSQGVPRTPSIYAAFFGFPLVGLLIGGTGLIRRRKESTAAFVVFLLFVASGVIVGCAGSTKFQSASTPPGNYMLTVTATATTPSGTLVHTSYVPLVVH